VKRGGWRGGSERIRSSCGYAVSELTHPTSSYDSVRHLAHGAIDLVDGVIVHYIVTVVLEHVINQRPPNLRQVTRRFVPAPSSQPTLRSN
jgi:hypothetical protein